MGASMAVETDEPVYPAGTQYGDFTGTVAADGHGGVTLFELAREVGLDLERYDLIGIEFGHRHLRGSDGLTLFAVDKAELGGRTLEAYAAEHGEIPVTDFLVHDLGALDLLSRGLKRLDVQLLSSYLPEGVPLRRTVRDDLNYSGD